MPRVRAPLINLSNITLKQHDALRKMVPHRLAPQAASPQHSLHVQQQRSPTPKHYHPHRAQGIPCQKPGRAQGRVHAVFQHWVHFYPLLTHVTAVFNGELFSILFQN